MLRSYVIRSQVATLTANIIIRNEWIGVRLCEINRWYVWQSIDPFEAHAFDLCNATSSDDTASNICIFETHALVLHHTQSCDVTSSKIWSFETNEPESGYVKSNDDTSGKPPFHSKHANRIHVMCNQATTFVPKWRYAKYDCSKQTNFS